MNSSPLNVTSRLPVEYDGGLDLGAQLAQLSGAEHDRSDRRAAAAEDEVVGAEAGELQLRLLDREEVLDRLGHRAVPVLGRDAQLVQLVLGLGKRDAAVQVDLQRLGSDVGGGDVGVDARIDAHRAARRAAAGPESSATASCSIST